MSKNKNVTFAWAFKNIIWPRRKTIFLGLLLILITRPAGLVLPWATRYLIDDVAVNGDMILLRWLLIAIIGSLLIQAVGSFLLTRILSVEAQYLISELRVKVQKKVLSLPISFFDNTKSGELVSRIMTDVEGVRNLVGTGLVQLIGGHTYFCYFYFLPYSHEPLHDSFDIGSSECFWFHCLEGLW